MNDEVQEAYATVKMSSERRKTGFRLTIEGDGLKLRCDVNDKKFTPQMVVYVLREFAARIEQGGPPKPPPKAEMS